MKAYTDAHLATTPEKYWCASYPQISKSASNPTGGLSGFYQRSTGGLPGFYRGLLGCTLCPPKIKWGLTGILWKPNVNPCQSRIYRKSSEAVARVYWEVLSVFESFTLVLRESSKGFPKVLEGLGKPLAALPGLLGLSERFFCDVSGVFFWCLRIFSRLRSTQYLVDYKGFFGSLRVFNEILRGFFVECLMGKFLDVCHLPSDCPLGSYQNFTRAAGTFWGS